MRFFFFASLLLTICQYAASIIHFICAPPATALCPSRGRAPPLWEPLTYCDDLNAVCHQLKNTTALMMSLCLLGALLIHVIYFDFVNVPSFFFAPFSHIFHQHLLSSPSLSYQHFPQSLSVLTLQFSLSRTWIRRRPR